MLVLLVSLAIIIVQTMLATFIATRAWDLRSARLLVAFSSIVIIIISIPPLRNQASPQIASWLTGAIGPAVAAYLLILMWLCSSLFMPSWWEGTRPVRWISLPYLIAIAAIIVDLVAGARIFTAGARLEDGIYRANLVLPNAVMLLACGLVGALVTLVMLGVAFARDRHHRGIIAFLMAAILLTVLLGQASTKAGTLQQLSNVMQTLPITIVFTYAVLGTRLFSPTRDAIDLALRAISDVVAVVDRSADLIYVNHQAHALGLRALQPLDQALGGAGVEPDAAATVVAQARGASPYTIEALTIGERRVALSITPVTDSKGRRQGTLLLGQDITELEQRNAELEHERARLAATVHDLEAEQRERAQLVATVQELSLPVIPVFDGVLVMPLIGSFAGPRIDEFVDILTAGIERARARLVLIDITGVPLLDSGGAAGLLRGVRAAGLLGARCVLVGIRPEIAQSLVALGAPLDELRTAATLQQALSSHLLTHRPAAN